MAANIDAVFKLFAKDKKTVSKADIGDIVRSQGLCPTERQLGDAMSSNGIGGEADLKQVKGTVSSLESTRSNDLAGVLKESFATFDSNGDGSVSITELTHVLTNLGEKMDEAQVNEVLHTASSAAVDSFGALDYNQFSKEAAANVDMNV
eukprot:m.385390 g.385390  ORF g.385390 m.385390 type:complete len:149 (+) comp21007_c0_seq1:126-572(+)